MTIRIPAGVMLEDDDLRPALAAERRQRIAQPLLLGGVFPGRAVGLLQQRGVEHDTSEGAGAEDIMVRTELPAVPRDRCRCRDVSDVVIARQAVQHDAAIEFAGNAMIGRNLC